MDQSPRLMSFEASMEPYAQLVRSLLPRAASVNLFDNAGKLLWSSTTRATPDLFALVDETFKGNTWRYVRYDERK